MRMQKPKTKGKTSIIDVIGKIIIYISIFLTLFSLIIIVGHIIRYGIPNLKPELFSLKYTSDNQSMFPAILNTLEIIAISLLLSVPIGIATAIYAVEYAKPGNKFVSIVRIMTQTLQGIPSIIYGLFGTLFFCYALGWDMSILSGSMTMSIMCLPLIIRSTEEALMAVPMNLREASYGLGARKARTVFEVVLPAASMGIFSGIVLSIGRIIGETAALIYTAGSMAKLAPPNQQGRTLAIHMYMQQTEGIHVPQSYATAFVLLIVVIILNFVSSYIENTLEAKEQGNV